MARPRAALPTTAARELTSSPERMYATTALSSDWVNVKGGMAVFGMPVAMSFFRSSSEDAFRNWPRRRSTPPTRFPAGPWQVVHCSPYSLEPFTMSAGEYWPGWSWAAFSTRISEPAPTSAAPTSHRLHLIFQRSLRLVASVSLARVARRGPLCGSRRNGYKIRVSSRIAVQHTSTTPSGTLESGILGHTFYSRPGRLSSTRRLPSFPDERAASFARVRTATLWMSCAAAMCVTVGLQAADVVESEPLHCWWRTSVSAVRIGE